MAAISKIKIDGFKAFPKEFELVLEGKNLLMYGENGKVNGEYFCQGYSVVYPGGGIPVHQHETIETYTILSGTGEMYVDGETQPLKAGDSIYIDRNLLHGLKNTGDSDMHVMYVYAPKMIVDHWAQEQS